MVALHESSRKGNAITIGMLIQHGANKDATDDNGATPLMWATINGKMEAVKVLLEAGAEQSIKATRNIFARKTAREIAVENGYQGIAALLDPRF